MESISEKAADFMHLDIDSLVTEIDEAQLIYQTSTLIKFKLNLNKLCNSEYKLD